MVALKDIPDAVLDGLPALCRDFVAYLAEHRRFSPHTARGYAADLRQLAEHLMPDMPDQAGEQMRVATLETMRDYLMVLGERGYTPATLARKVATLRSFYKWMLT